MKTSEITYTLPPEKIAKYPPRTRGDAKLLVLHRSTGSIEHRQYTDIIDYLEPKDLIVRNNTKVIPARMITQNPRGGTVELLLLEYHQLKQESKNHFECLYGGNIQLADSLQLVSNSGRNRNESITLKVKEITDHGTVIIISPLTFPELLQEHGHTPIPPYLKREDTEEDRTRYQTEFAEIEGSVAAPTASLNFTSDLENTLINKGIKIEEITLHVGRGTFLPVKTNTIEEHIMHKEFYSIPGDTLKLIRETKSDNHSIIALGTTVSRALEHASSVIRQHDEGSTTSPIQAEADIFIYPGYEFKIIDKLLTNFHAPNSTVLLLAAAFAGVENLLIAYQEALENDYKFLSYGDSMLII